MKELNRAIDRFNAMPIYFRLVLLIVNFVLFFGVIGPSMISSNSTVAVWVGIILLVADSYIAFIFSKVTIKELKK